MTDFNALREQFVTYPYPLGMVAMETLVLAERWLAGEPVPNLPFDICRASGLLLRMNAAIAIRAYIDSGMEDGGLNIEIVNALRAPSDGAWCNLAPRLTGYLAEREAPALVGALDTALAGAARPDMPVSPAGPAVMRDVWKQKARDASAVLGALVSYRNKAVHGARLSAADHGEALARLFAVLTAHGFYSDYNILVRQDGIWLDCDATVPRPLQVPDDPLAPWWGPEYAESLGPVVDGQPLIASQSDPADRLTLSPLLHFTAGASEHVQFDELLFLNRGTREAAEYIAYRHGAAFSAASLGNYEEFRRFLADIPTPPLAPDRRINFYGLYEFHHERFVGREEVLEEVARLLRETDRPYVELRALAGMGKTAILAELYGRHGSREQIPWPLNDRLTDSPLPADTDRWAFHFCMAQDGRDDPLVALQSIVCQLCDGAALRRGDYLSNQLPEQRARLSECLAAVRGQLEPGRRVFVCIDALDEGIPVSGRHTVPGALPGEGEEEPPIPDSVVFLVSHRVDEAGQGRADQYMEHVPGAWRQRMTTADPLAGLDRDDVAALLVRLQDQVAPAASVPERTLDAVWAAATADTPEGASPFYLRFLGDDLLAGQLDLSRPESVPPDLAAVFARTWMSLPADHDYALHRMLATLAVMRDYADDGLMQAVVNQERPAGAALDLETVRGLRAAAGKLLVYDGDRYGLFHDKLREFLVGPTRSRLEEALEASRMRGG